MVWVPEAEETVAPEVVEAVVPEAAGAVDVEESAVPGSEDPVPVSRESHISGRGLV